MTTHVLNNNRNRTWEIASSNDTWIVGAKAVLSAKDEYGIHEGANVQQSRIQVLGDIKLDTVSTYAAIYVGGDATRVHIADTGRLLVTANAGVRSQGDLTHVVNDGLIKSGINGIWLSGERSYAENNGTIRADTGFWMQGENSAIENRGLVDASRIGAAIQMDGTTLTNFASGRIISDDIGLYLNSAHDGQLINREFFKAQQLVQDDVSDFRIVNTGRIVADANMGAGIDIVVNKGGSIVGDVLLGADNDLFVFTGGSVDGIVNGGEGHDVYRVLKGAVDIVEDALGGDDTIRAAVTFTLGENIEDLVLTGKRAINGTGNDLGNLMAGNTANNKLRGGAGDDILDGRKGNDILVGGQDADTFLFATGHGNDTIVDFQNGVDKIDLTAWDGIDSYIDMILGHLTVDGNDLVITNGDDTLRLRNVDVAELDSTDFAI